MTCGAPVIASDRGAIPEVADNAAILLDAEDAHGWAEQIERVLTDPELAQKLRARGLQRAAQFSWQRNARQMLECYTRVVSQ
jgi:glycosyltransferase involved in cell wall biosynthesis